MEQRDEAIIRSLLDQDFELRRHYAQHRDFEREIDALNGRPALTTADEMARKTLQKKKLAGMDRMRAIISRYRTSEIELAPS